MVHDNKAYIYDVCGSVKTINADTSYDDAFVSLINSKYLSNIKYLNRATQTQFDDFDNEDPSEFKQLSEVNIAHESNESLLETIDILAKLPPGSLITPIAESEDVKTAFESKFIGILTDDEFKQECINIFNGKFTVVINEHNIHVKIQWVFSVFIDIDNYLDSITIYLRPTKCQYNQFHGVARCAMQPQFRYIKINIASNMWSLFKTSDVNKQKLLNIKQFFDTTKAHIMIKPFEFLVFNNAFDPIYRAEVSLHLSASCGNQLLCTDPNEICKYFMISNTIINQAQGTSTSCFLDSESLLNRGDLVGICLDDIYELIMAHVTNNENLCKALVKRCRFYSDLSGIEMRS